MSVHEIFIPKWRPAGLNELMNCHWRKKQSLKKRDKNMVAYHLINIPKATGKRRLDVEYILGYRMKQFDSDNDKKSLYDALVQSAALVDDNHKFLEPGETTYSRDWDNWGTRIILTDVN